MGLRIRTNLLSLTARRHLEETTNNLRKHMDRLSSGKRINSASDDAAGLAISEKLRANIRGLGQAQRNAGDGVSLLQVAEGGLNEISNIVIRLKELAIQSASDTISDRERSYLGKEFDQLKEEIDRITLSTEFNGQRLLTGKTPLPRELDQYNEGPPLEIQVDKDYYSRIDGPKSSRPLNTIRLDLSSVNTMTSGRESLLGEGISEEEGNSPSIEVNTKVEAQTSITKLDEALEKISSYRARIGSLQNRLQYAQNNLSTRIENLSAARSRIIDADFAEDSAELAKFSILQQAGLSVLVQANQLPRMALKLLEG